MKYFADLLKLIEREYHFDACFIADHLHVEDEKVEAWEKGTSYPSEKEAEDFAELFALPRELVKESIERGKNNESKTLPDHSGL